MAQLKDTVISGDLSVTDSIHTGGINAFAMGTCSTAAATAAKVVTIDDPGWTLQKGSCIAVKFTATNTNSTPTLNVNNTGAKSIWYGEQVCTTAAGTAAGTANRYSYFIYDGTNWVWLGQSRDANDNTLVNQSATTTTSWRKVLLHYTQDASATAAVGNATNVVYGAVDISAQPSQGKVHMKALNLPVFTATASSAGADRGSSNTSTRYLPATWTFNTGITPVDGDTLRLKKPIDGHDYGTWITTDNGTSWHPIVLNTSSRFTSHFGNGTVLFVQYDATGTVSIYARGGAMSRTTVTGVWRIMNLYDSGNTNDSAGYIRPWSTNSVTKVTAATYRYMLLLSAGDGQQYIPACTTSNSTATSKTTITTSAFNMFDPIFYYSHTDTVAAAGTIRNDRIWSMYRIALSYSFNTGTTLTAGKDVYLVATPQSNGVMGKLRNPGNTGANASAAGTTGPVTQVLPTTEDGYCYIYLGKAYSTDCITLWYAHPIYWYKDGGIKPYSGVAKELPTVTSSDNGKFLRVDGGIWKAVTVPDANGVSF